MIVSAITLEQFARDNGFLYPHHQVSCTGSSRLSDSKIDPTQSLNTFNHQILELCQVQLLGHWFDTTSFPLYVSSISIALQALVVGSLGDAADDGETDYNTFNLKLHLCFFLVLWWRLSNQTPITLFLERTLDLFLLSTSHHA